MEGKLMPANDGFIQIGGAPNFTALPSTVVTSGATAALMGPEWLKTDEPSERFRLVDFRPGQAFVQIQKTEYGKPRLGGLINYSNPGNAATFRARASTSAISGPEAIAPSGLLLDENVDGAISDLDDDPDVPDGLWMTVNDGAEDVELVLSFPDPPGALEAGEDYQEFRLLLRRSSFGSAPVLCHIDLYQNGVLKQALDSLLISSTLGQVIVAPWDASVLTGSANVQCRIRGVSNGTDCIEVGAVRWYRDVAGNPAYDSGWQPFPVSSVDLIAEEADLGSFWGGTNAATVGYEPTRNMVVDLGANLSPLCNFFRLDFRFGPDISYFDAGVGIFTPAFSPKKVNFVGSFSVIDESPIETTDGGQTYGAILPRRRAYDVAFTSLDHAEALTLFDRLDWRKGTSSPVLIRMFPDELILQPHTTAWVTIQDAGKIDLWRLHQRHGKTYKFVEKS
jgi:hypothetical protein